MSFIDEVREAVHRKAALSPKMRDAVIEGLRAEGLLVDEDTARLVKLGRAVEKVRTARQVRGDQVPYHWAWNACLDTIAREAGVEQ